MATVALGYPSSAQVCTNATPSVRPAVESIDYQPATISLSYPTRTSKTSVVRVKLILRLNERHLRPS
jgi:hypothetical protein